MNSRSTKAKSRAKKLTLSKQTVKDLSARNKGAAGVRGGRPVNTGCGCPQAGNYTDSGCQS
jgi:hypothetical protein